MDSLQDGVLTRNEGINTDDSISSITLKNLTTDSQAFNDFKPCFTKEQLSLIGDLNISIDTNCSAGNDVFIYNNWGLGMTPIERLTLSSIYGLMAFVAIAMNLFIVVVVFKNHLHKRPTYLFIAILALSDLVMLTFNMPLQLYYAMVDNWIFGATLCHIAYPIFCLPVYISSWTIMLISLDRCIATRPVSKSGLTRTQAILLVAIVILVSILFSIPLIMYTRYERLQDRIPFYAVNKAYCIEQWPEDRSSLRLSYGVTVVTTLFLLPVLVTVILHARIYLVLHQSFKKSQRKLHITNTVKQKKKVRLFDVRGNRSYERKKAVGNTLISIVVVFIVCWSPFNFFMMIKDFIPEIPAQKIRLIHMVLQILATSSSCINPVFYGWLNRAFREEAVTLIKTCRGPECIEQALKRRLSVQISEDTTRGPDTRQSALHRTSNSTTEYKKIARVYEPRQQNCDKEMYNNNYHPALEKIECSKQTVACKAANGHDHKLETKQTPLPAQNELREQIVDSGVDYSIHGKSNCKMPIQEDSKTEMTRKNHKNETEYYRNNHDLSKKEIEKNCCEMNCLLPKE